VFGLMFYYMFRYRAGSDIDRGEVSDKSWHIESTWTAATLIVFFGLSLWGADLYVRLFHPPRTFCRSMSSANSGCGRCSTPAVSAKSMPCTCPSEDLCS
jgi:heme/copper-type cytochrome/quinol oxidase subunit 2